MRREPSAPSLRPEKKRGEAPGSGLQPEESEPENVGDGSIHLHVSIWSGARGVALCGACTDGTLSPVRVDHEPSTTELADVTCGTCREKAHALREAWAKPPLLRDHVPLMVSRLIGDRPVRWAPQERLVGDYDGRERTLEIFNADAKDQRRLRDEIDKRRAEIQAAAGGSLVIIFHSVRQSEERHADFVVQWATTLRRGLSEYLILEKTMLALDAKEDPRADEVRDVMDPIWRRLSKTDRAFLDSRGMLPNSRSAGQSVGQIGEDHREASRNAWADWTPEDVEQELESLQPPAPSQIKSERKEPSWLGELLAALGWQGGTIHQALAEVRTLHARAEDRPVGRSAGQPEGVGATPKGGPSVQEAFLRSDISALLEVLRPLIAVADAYDANNLDDEARRFWGKDLENENTTPPDQIEIYSGRGGEELITLAHCLRARQVQRGLK